MERKKRSIAWGRVVRRTVAAFMATLAVWVLAVTAGSGGATAVFRSLGERADLVTALLSHELGALGADELDGLGAMALGQSALLRGNRRAVAAYLKRPSTPTLDRPAGGQSAQNDPLTPREDHSEDEPEPPAITAAPGDIVPRTLIPNGTEGYLYANGTYIFNRTDLAVDAAALDAAPVKIHLGEPTAPQILIMHTHATEAYAPSGSDVYTPTDPSRTLDNEQNMTRIGREMKAVFESLGLSVVHDETPYDYPYYKDSYVRSGEGVAKYLEQYPSIQIVLDVHRDALVGADDTVYKTLTKIDGADVAQIELVVGSNQKGTHPEWQENLTLAMKLQRSMNTLYPTLARPIAINASAYNQALTHGSLLVEVGSHGNTLQESIAAARLFARSAGQVLLNLPQ